MQGPGYFTHFAPGLSMTQYTRKVWEFII